MSELIKITEINNSKTISGKELHEFLEVGRNFSEWIKGRIIKYEFIEDIDYTVKVSTPQNGGIAIDYILGMSMAKELSMVENNDKGKQARKYFIECEKQLKQSFKVPQTFAQALLLASQQAELIEKQEKLLLESKPKVEFFDAVADSKTAVPMNEVAKVLNIKNMGRNNLFEYLREHKILMSNNIPYQKYIDCNYFRVIEQKYLKDGEQIITFKTLVYQRGVEYIRKMVSNTIPSNQQ